MTPVRPAPGMTPADIARNLLLLQASEALSATVTTADVVDAVSHLRATGLDASHLQVILPGEPSDGVPGVHTHPALPRTVRVGVQLSF